MLDIQLLRNDLAGVAARLQTRGFVLDTAAFERLEAERKDIQTRTQELQAKRNAVSKQIGAAKVRGEDASALMAEVTGIGDEPSLARAAPGAGRHAPWFWRCRICRIRALPWSYGGGQRRKVAGARRGFDFEPRDHVDIGAIVGGIN